MLKRSPNMNLKDEWGATALHQCVAAVSLFDPHIRTYAHHPRCDVAAVARCVASVTLLLLLVGHVDAAVIVASRSLVSVKHPSNAPVMQVGHGCSLRRPAIL
jgi:hypothetical protein